MFSFIVGITLFIIITVLKMIKLRPKHNLFKQDCIKPITTLLPYSVCNVVSELTI